MELLYFLIIKNFRNHKNLAASGLKMLSEFGVTFDEFAKIWPSKFEEFVGDKDLEERLKIEGFYMTHNERLVKQV
jgi:hypothetical protein